MILSIMIRIHIMKLTRLFKIVIQIITIILQENFLGVDNIGVYMYEAK